MRLREIAEDADVNFGLVYQYLGTREELLRAVYQRVSARSATRFEHIDDLADAIDIFLTADDSVGRIMGWAALEGDPVDVFGPSPGLAQVASMMVRAARQDGRTTSTCRPPKPTCSPHSCRPSRSAGGCSVRSG
ncbi:hypothetical protein CcI49_19785 [Frankia sp. CcI49]|uniref:TetR/AcrR family transcriptional regulator n=1 Tax=Frankia sp. CcI49 TaxID=1745382 RepID=UPI0009754795|nr:TetR/AcrR family transcriptional regulator [Frankia sp. CcI49]ONH58954.1 hypothetical protein CcI49_19785 [Frankia sp. CcI49]